MTEETKKTFPMLPVAHWWALRKKFKQSIPGVVTDNYLATVLEMKVDSARVNVLPYLKQLGIIDDQGRTGDRANAWRDDEGYIEVCKQILREVYPSDLLEAVDDPAGWPILSRFVRKGGQQEPQFIGQKIEEV